MVTRWEAFGKIARILGALPTDDDVCGVLKALTSVACHRCKECNVAIKGMTRDLPPDQAEETSAPREKETTDAR